MQGPTELRHAMITKERESVCVRGDGKDVCSFLDVFGSSCSLVLVCVCSSTVVWIVIVQNSCLRFESEW